MSRVEKVCWTTAAILAAFIVVRSYFEDMENVSEQPRTSELIARDALRIAQQQGGVLVLLGDIECPEEDRHTPNMIDPDTTNNQPSIPEQFSADGRTIKVQYKYESPVPEVGAIYCGQLLDPNTSSVPMPNAIITEHYIGKP